ncbi:hypothetical protein PG999_001232 [Apiospora kogelbergensis]|uniref:Purine nucleoside permease n=1 Tax=Apiospora kogelbergensis TaxID=1337665 RepID=A0AAW0RE89_9PEZI
MLWSLPLSVIVLCWSHVSSADAIPQRQENPSSPHEGTPRQAYNKIAPKVMILNMFNEEAKIWHESIPSLGKGSLWDKNISLGGLSPLYPQAHCTSAGDVCQATLGESEINAAASMAALVLGADAASAFDFARTYWLVSGVAGVNPKLGTLGSVALARFAVQAALQYELDARDMPANFSTGYLAYGTDAPGRPPKSFYGTEVMELNEALRDAAFDLARNGSGSGPLADDPGAAAYRAKYGVDDDGDTGADGYGEDGGSRNSSPNIYVAATAPPSVLRCDSVTSDNYYSGRLLSEAFENTTRIWTNQSQVTYCMTAQEDSAVLQVLLRAHIARRADFSRAIIMRAGSNFDRPPPSMTAFEHLLLLGQNGFALAVNNTWNAGSLIVSGILSNWDDVYGPGIPPTNYIGDVFGSLGGPLPPNFGSGKDVFGGKGAAADGSTDGFGN